MVVIIAWIWAKSQPWPAFHGSVCQQRTTYTMAWINNCHHTLLGDVIMHPCSDANDCQWLRWIAIEDRVWLCNLHSTFLTSPCLLKIPLVIKVALKSKIYTAPLYNKLVYLYVHNSNLCNSLKAKTITIGQLWLAGPYSSVLLWLVHEETWELGHG